MASNLAFSAVVGKHLPAVMQDRTAMQNLERDVDAWMAQNYKRTPAEKESFKKQLDNAKGAIESLYNRVIQQL